MEIIAILFGNHKDALGALRAKVCQANAPATVVAGSPYFWLSQWTKDTLGYFLLCRLLGLKHSRILAAKVRIKEFLNIFRGPSPVFFVPEDFDPEALVFSWSSAAQLREAVAGKDRYFGERTAQKNIGRIYLVTGLISDQEIADVVAKGIALVVFRRSMLRPISAFLLIIKDVIRFGPKHLKHLTTGTYVTSRIFTDRLLQKLSGRSRLRLCIFPYEAQPMQNQAILALQEQLHIPCVGYVHSSIHAFPSFMLHRRGAPKYLWTHGHANIRLLLEHLGWPADSVSFCPAFRYQPRSPSLFLNKLFLPYGAIDSGVLRTSLRGILTAFPDIKQPEVRIHPDFSQDPRQLQLQQCLQELVAKQSPTQGLDASIFVGISTSMLEALELGIESAIQISEIQELESYNEVLWPELSVEHLGQTVTRYRLKDKGAFIDFTRPHQKSFDEYVCATLMTIAKK